MAGRRGFGNPFSRMLAEAIDKVAPEVLDGILDVAAGPSKSSKNPTPSSTRSTDWHTRAPAPTRNSKRR